MRAIALDNHVVARIGTGLPENALQLAQTLAPTSIEEQRLDVQVGQVAAAAMPPFVGRA